MLRKEIICHCGYKETFRYTENDLVVHCSSCGVGHLLSSKPFQSKVSLTEDGAVVVSQRVKKGELLEKCPLVGFDSVGGWGFLNNKGVPVIPLGLILRYGQSSEGNVSIEIKEHFLFVFASHDMEKHHPLKIRSLSNESRQNNHSKV